MPIGEVETHPYLLDGAIHGATKMILGSFPVYECTNPDNQIKLGNREAEGTVRFFYGSVDSRLWGKYIAYVDNNLDLPPNPQLILESLSHFGVAISDTITQSERRDFSSSDSDLRGRQWNRRMILDLITSGVTKVLCTSKGVLSDLERKIICPANFGQVDMAQSLGFQHNFIQGIGGSDTLLQVSPVARVFTIGEATVQALAIPSPGSPQRKIKNFGYHGGIDVLAYAESYFQSAFDWLMLDE
ncbi:hypothetical protein [uncultured Pontibacter sp.]|uniref:hypothetical protein n=1 Tax=uncultured Pontibacter sp. TaxID=453356 RepID=UPI00262B12AD|nr:hypothetical protein [uncultured Pontibacter sp.]